MFDMLDRIRPNRTPGEKDGCIDVTEWMTVLQMQKVMQQDHRLLAVRPAGEDALCSCR
jgi:hypothetical protein